jgi:Ca2+/Na+ antiporter
MLQPVHIGQFVGSCVWNIGIIAAGAYVALIWPRKLQNEIATGKLSNEEAQAKFKRFRPWCGYLIMAYGFLEIVSDYIHAFY